MCVLDCRALGIFNDAILKKRNKTNENLLHRYYYLGNGGCFCFYVCRNVFKLDFVRVFRGQGCAQGRP